MYKASELRNKSDEDLDVKLVTLHQEIFGLRSERLDSKTQKTHLIRQKRKEVACILTIKRERELTKV